ncbi:MAG: Asp-tRNA(Asn)/Glu-tRNA(Gln) amidotransferase subunit GatB [Ignavibacteriae bacterium]|nr:Asp-tRNA(Asn)/Glu-tRNA(Gln) amidotransferase subunit GatB [Ignavibacteriota bacterium]
MNDPYEPVIGLEVHAQLLTESKAFCSCTTKFGNEPNTNVCPVCLGMPGVLPVLNKNVVEFVIRVGLAMKCNIAQRSIFARKNYFYPDLPKGYQISQYEEPICSGGYVEIDLDDHTRKKIGLTRIHMEEDAGKSIHDLDVDTLVDINRCGVPLIEIVSEPDISSPREAYLYLYKIRQIVTYLGICDGNMEEGSLRCDANVSVRRKGEKKFGTKTEVKNMNSFRYVERALEFEINRQIQLLEEAEEVVQETLLWDANQNIAYPMRSKEEAHDYRYFPEPDLVPVVVDEPWIDRVRATLPEHPTTRYDRFIAEYALPQYDADILTTEKSYADYFELVLKELHTKNKEQIKLVSNWVMTDVLRVVSEQKIDIKHFPISPTRLATMISLINDGTISGKIAKEVFEEMLKSSDDPRVIIEKKGLMQLSDQRVIEKVVTEVLDRNTAQVEKYLAGNEKVFGYFVGEVMKATKGKANPRIVNDILKKKFAHIQVSKG